MSRSTPGPLPHDPNRLTDLVRRVRLTLRLLRDPRVPWVAKMIPVLAVLYVLSPVDLVPDIPIIGQIDDVAVLLLALKAFIDMAAPEAGLDGGAGDDDATVIGAEYRVREADETDDAGGE